MWADVPGDKSYFNWWRTNPLYKFRDDIAVCCSLFALHQKIIMTIFIRFCFVL